MGTLPFTFDKTSASYKGGVYVDIHNQCVMGTTFTIKLSSQRCVCACARARVVMCADQIVECVFDRTCRHADHLIICFIYFINIDTFPYLVRTCQGVET